MKKFLLLCIMTLLLSACAGKADLSEETVISSESLAEEAVSQEEETEIEKTEEALTSEIETVDVEITEEETTEVETTVEETTEEETEVFAKGKLVVIDAGHQAHGNNDLEPIGPGASEKKPKVATGTQGYSTGLCEYELNLMVAKKLEMKLISRGYDVVMIRDDHDVDISNAERAMVANDLNADCFIRVHANGSDDHSISGALTICQTKNNPYNGSLYKECRLLSDCVLSALCDETGAKKRDVWETDTMSGINWCSVPVTIVEMGFMSNSAEDELMARDSYQESLAEGMAKGIDRYFDEIG